MIAYGLTLAALSLSVTAQIYPIPSNTTAVANKTVAGNVQTSITVLAGALTTGLAGSIISADACATTYALACTDDSNYICAAADSYGITITATYGPTAYEFEYDTSTEGAAATISQSCDLAGPVGSFTQAVCTETFKINGDGINTATSTTTTVTDTNMLSYATLPITAGASKLPSGSAVCTQSGNSAAATGISEVYKIIVPVGAAIAGALL